MASAAVLAAGTGSSVAATADNTPADHAQRFIAAQKDAAELRARLDAPGQRALRARSRTAHAGLSDGDAVALGGRVFPSIFGVAWSPDSGLRDNGQRVKRFVDDRTAQVTLASGETTIATSSVAMRPKDEDRPADLRLRAEGEFVTPANPIAGLRVRGDRSASVDFGAGTTAFAPAHDGGPGAPQTVGSWRVLPNIFADTDYAVGATAVGAEAAWVLRSARSPETLRLNIELADGQRLISGTPSGPRLAASDPGGPMPTGARIIDHEGRTVTQLLPPYAVDADGTPVTVSMYVDGDSVVVQAAHRAQDVRYPLFVDPVIHHQQNGNGFSNYDGWSAAVVGSPNRAVNTGIGPDGCLGLAALCLSADPGQFYNFSTSEFIYTSPHNSYIYRVDFGGLYSQVDQNQAAFFQGIFDQANGRWEPNSRYWATYNYDHPGPGDIGGGAPRYTHAPNNAAMSFCTAGHIRQGCDANAGGLSNQAIMGLTANGVMPRWQSAFMLGAVIYTNDRQVPQIDTPTHTGRPAGWSDDFTASATTTARQHGLGLKSLDMSTSPTGTGAVPSSRSGQVLSSCDGTKTKPCPYQIGPTRITYNTASLPEGTSTLHLRAQDILARRAYRSWTVSIDRTRPTLGPISGTLWDARNRDDDHRFEGVNDDQVTLSATSTDQHAGVREIQVLVNDQPRKTVQGATLNWTWDLNTDPIADGAHKIQIVVRDNAYLAGSTSASRHETKSAPFYVTIDRLGDVQTAEEFSNPDGTGPADAVEHAEPATSAERRDEDGLVSTRRRIQCPADNSAQCLESRRYAETAETGDNEGAMLAVQRGTTATDARVGSVVSSRPGGGIGGVIQTGALTSALAPWQVPPPGHGPTYALHELSETSSVDGVPTAVTERHWIDQQTGLVLRRSRFIASTLEEDTYYSYRPRVEATALPADFFNAGGAMTPTTLTVFPTDPDHPPITHDAEPLFEALFDASQKFREQFGLPSQPESAISALTDVARALSLEEFGVLLLQDEIEELRERDLADAAMAEVETYASQSAPNSYAGSYIDQQAGGLIRVGFTQDSSQHLSALQAIFPYPNRLRTFTASRTLQALDSLRSQVDDDLDYLTDTMQLDMQTIDTDVAENVVRISAGNPTSSQSQAIATRYGAGVQLVAGDEFFFRQGSRFRTYRPGLAVPAGIALTTSTGVCSSAFSVRRGARYRVLTAGHCGARGTLYRRYDNTNQTGEFPLGVSTARQLGGELDV